MSRKITLNGQFRKSISEVFEEFVVSRTASSLGDIDVIKVLEVFQHLERRNNWRHIAETTEIAIKLVADCDI